MFSSKNSVKFGFEESKATTENKMKTIKKKEVIKIKKIELI